MPMFPCLNISTIRPVPLADKLQIIAKAGFRHVELWSDDMDLHLRQTGETVADLRRRIDDEGLTVQSVIAFMGWAEAPAAGLNTVLDECRRRAEQAAAVGSRAIVVSPPMEDLPEDLFAERFALVRQIAIEHGLVPMLEFLGFTQKYKSIDSIIGVSQRYPAGAVPIVADTYHLLRGGGRLEDILKISATELGIFHINDLPASPPVLTQTDFDRVMLGEGIVPLDLTISLLRQIGYNGPVSLELFNEKLWQADPADVLKTGFERLSRLLV